MALLSFSVGSVLVVVLGGAVCCGWRRWGRGAGELAVAWGSGVAVAAVAFVAVGLAGWPVSAWGVGGLLVGLAGGAWALERSARGTPGGGAIRDPAWAAEPAWLLWGARVALAAAVAVFLCKLYLAPVWSWDHFVMWGLKARRLAASGRLDFSFLAEAQLQRAKADAPVGLPVAWLLFSGGSVPGAVTFKLVHGAFALGLLACVRSAASRLAASAVVGDLAAAFVAVSPLLWDTTSLGLADLPLAFFATASVAALLAALPDEAAVGGTDGAPADPRGLAVAGLLAGFAPWIKDEGLPLALLLASLAALWILRTPAASPTRPEPVEGPDPSRDAPHSPTSPELVEGRGPSRDAPHSPISPELVEGRGPSRGHGSRARWRLLTAFALPAAIGLVSMALVDRFALPEGDKFLTGHWLARGVQRLGEQGPQIAAAVGRELAAREWLGFWFVFPLAAVLTLRRGRRRARALAALVVAQLALYLAVIVASYLPPLDQVGSGLFRIAAALVPLGVLPLAALARRRSGEVEWSAAMPTDDPFHGPFAFIRRFASRLRYPQLFFLTAGLFVIDLVVPDVVPFADEILLGLVTLLLSRLRERNVVVEEDDEPRMKNVTPPK